MLWFILSIVVVWFSPIGRALRGHTERLPAGIDPEQVRELEWMTSRMEDRIADIEERIDDIERGVVKRGRHP